jgi:hypothetical protein
MKKAHRNALRCALGLLCIVNTIFAFAAEEKKQPSSRQTNQSSFGERAAPSARADLIAIAQAAKLAMFSVRNAGGAASTPSHATVECRTKSTGAPCMPNQHYVNLPPEAGVAFPPGTMMTAPNRWKYPVPGLAPNEEHKFALGVWPTASEAAGLVFRLCADVDSGVIESNESNNCAEVLYVKPK